MGEQKNLFLAIGLSVAIIIGFQFLFPQQQIISPSSEKIEGTQPTASIDDSENIKINKIQTKEEIIQDSERVIINTSTLSGSINLTGAILDDLILLNYKESLDPKSKNISLLSPDGTTNPYYIEFGWKELSSNSTSIDLPSSDTKWSTSGSFLEANSPVTLFWNNKQNSWLNKLSVVSVMKKLE